MKELTNFFQQIGKLKKIPRRGWVLIGIKNPATVVDHSFRTAIMAWVLGKKKRLSAERVIKMSLIHDFCELYAGDITPYDYNSILPKDKQKWPKLFDTWPRFSKSEKIKIFLKKHKKEHNALIKLTSRLPLEIKQEIMNLWLDYEKQSSKEARFVRQINRIETLFQALEYSRESKRRPFHSWWIGSEEQIDDPLLVELMLELERKFYQKNKKKRKSLLAKK